MAHITVTIWNEHNTSNPQPGEPITYSPSNQVKQGDRVSFVLSGYSVGTVVTLTFKDAETPGACFAHSGPFNLKPFDLVPKHRQVSPSASKGFHAFEVSIEPDPSHEGARPPADRKNGGIEVTGDPQEPAPR